MWGASHPSARGPPSLQRSFWTWALGRRPEKEKRRSKPDADRGAGATGLHRPHCPPRARWAVAASRAACPLLVANFHDTAWGTRRAGWTLQTGALQHRTQQGSREGPGAPRRGVGRRGQMRLGLTCYPGGSLSYPASVCLPMGWVPAGGSGDRGRLGAGCAASRSLALPWAATFRRPPTNAAPGLGS